MDLLVITSQPPYSSSDAIDALESALAATNVGLEVGFLFNNEGVLQLLQHQEPPNIGHKSTLKRLSLLPLFDIETILICKKSIKKYGISLEHLDFDYELVDDKKIQIVINNSTSVLVF